MPDRPVVQDGNGNTVPLRVYVERIFEERQAAHWAIHDLHNRQHDQQHVQEGVARALAFENINERLGKLNELRVDVETDRALFMTRDKFEGIEDTWDARLKPLEEFKSRAAGYAIFLSLGSTVLGAAVGVFIGRAFG